MNYQPNKPADPPQSQDTTIYRWEGHMSDGVGATSGSEPMAFLSASSGNLVLSGLRGTFQFTRSTIVRLGRASLYPWFFAGIRIHHDIPDCPDKLQFKSVEVRASEILSRLKALGYPVA